eukprot:scaffold2487_cov98-Skeletonema_dohrnii-CCMP3373.AAC.9
MESHSDADSDPFDDGSTHTQRSVGSGVSISTLPFNGFFQYSDDFDTAVLKGSGSDDLLRNLTDEGWEELGRNLANHSRSRVEIRLHSGAINDHKIPLFFRGLTNSNPIQLMALYENGLSAAAVQSMVPFLQNANYLKELYLSHNNFQSEGFNVMFRALRDSSIQMLSCNNCGIEAIEIDSEHIPKHLTTLRLSGNRINADGCRQLSKILQGDDATLKRLYLRSNKIDDDGVAILVDSLQKNASLQILDLRENDGISDQGRIMLLRLVNDVSCITATLHSNHTLTSLDVEVMNPDDSFDADDEIQRHINMATKISRNNVNSWNNVSNPEAAGREKVIKTQLHSEIRADLCRLQGVHHSVYSDIDPLHLPEVLSLIGRHHGQGELYLALKSSIMTLFSTVNVRKCFQQQKAYHAGIVAKHAAIVAEHAAIVAEHRNKMEELDAKLASMDEAAEVNEGSNELEHHSNKRRRN